jgi:uncharacterized protein (DUF1499 family)
LTCQRIKILAVIVGLLTITGCTGKHLRVLDGNRLELAGCTPLPNCVSSTTVIFYNRTAQFELAMPRAEAWPLIKEVIAKIPRAEIVEDNETYIHAKCRSRVFQFVDNLELLLHPEQNTISVRSSSLIAIFDFGVNRWRIHELRKHLEERKIIKQDRP